MILQEPVMSVFTDESKRNRRTAKRILAIGLPLVAIAATGVGYAYWTASGTGTGSASSAAGASNLAFLGNSVTGLAPGAGSKNLSVLVTNNAANAAHVSQVVVAVASVTPVSGSCDATDYVLSPLSGIMTTTTPDLAASGGTATFNAVTIDFVNKGTAQDGCKGATVNLSYTAS
jgi:hypothetical protein